MDDSPAHSGAPLSAPNKPSELDRLHGILIGEGELINALTQRLNQVRSISPEEPMEKSDDGIHLVSLVDFANFNNKRLQKLIDDLVI